MTLLSKSFHRCLPIEAQRRGVPVYVATEVAMVRERIRLTYAYQATWPWWRR